MDSMIQILEGLDVQAQPPCPCKRGPCKQGLGDAPSLVESAPAKPLIAALLLFAGGFALDKARRKR